MIGLGRSNSVNICDLLASDKFKKEAILMFKSVK